MKVRNGVCTTRTGFRCVVIDKDGNVKPIVEIWQNGYASHRCTLQEYDRTLAVNIDKANDEERNARASL